MMRDDRCCGCRRHGDEGEGRHESRHEFRSGIPGDYFEQIDGTYVEPPCERARREHEEAARAGQGDGVVRLGDEVLDGDGNPIPVVGAFPDCGTDDMGDDGTGAGEPSITDDVADRLVVSDALLRVRLACNALEGMCHMVSGEHGLCMTATFLPPYHGDDARVRADEGNGEPPFSEWMILVNGEPVAMGCYEKLCEVWMDGPDAMHEWLESVISWDIAAETLMDTLNEIFHLHRREDGAGDDGDGYRSIFATPEEWDRTYEPTPEQDGDEDVMDDGSDIFENIDDDGSDESADGRHGGGAPFDGASVASRGFAYEDEAPTMTDEGTGTAEDASPCECECCHGHHHHHHSHGHRHGHHGHGHHRHGRHHHRHGHRHWGHHEEPRDDYGIPESLRYRYDLQPGFQCEMPVIDSANDEMAHDAERLSVVVDASRNIELAEARHTVIQALEDKGYEFMGFCPVGSPRITASLIVSKEGRDEPILVGIALPGEHFTLSERLEMLACDARYKPEMDYMLCYVDGDSVVVVREP